MKDFLRNIWRRLTEPMAGVVDADERLQAQLLSLFIIFLVPVAYFVTLIPKFIQYESRPWPWGQLVILGLATIWIAITYFLSRTRYHRWAAFSLLLVISAVIFSSIFVDPFINLGYSIYYVFIAIIIAAFVLPFRWALAFTIINLLGIILIPWVIPELSVINMVIGPLLLVIMASVALFLLVYYRNQVEMRRLNQLAESENRFRNLFESVFDGMAIVQQGHIVIANQGLADMFRYALADLPGTAVAQFVVQAHQDLLNQALEENLQRPLELQGQRTNGDLFYIELLAQQRRYQQKTEQIIALRDIDQRKKAEFAMRNQVNIMNRLQEAAQIFTATLDLHAVLQLIAQQLCLAVDGTSAYICSFDNASRKSQVLCDYFSIHASENERIPDVGGIYDEEDQGYIATFFNGQPIIAHIDDSDLVDEEREHMLAHDAKTILYVPLQYRGRVNSFAEIWESRERREFTQQEITLAQSIAQQAAVALENARLYEQAQHELADRHRAEANVRQRVAELEVLAAVSDTLSAAHSIEEMLPVIIRKATNLIKAEVGAIFLIDEESDELVARAVYPSNAPFLGMRIEIGKGITGRVAATGKPFISEDVLLDSLAPMVQGDPTKDHPLRSCIALPLQTEAEIIGVLQIGTSAARVFSVDEIRLLTALSNMAANAIFRAGVMETLEIRVSARTQELAQANERLKDLDALKTKFISDISHELRTPITNLKLYFDLLQRGRPERRDSYLQILNEQIDRLTELTESILTVSRLDMNRDQLKLNAVDLNQLVPIWLNSFRAQASDCGLDILFEPGDVLPSVKIDAERMKQVVVELMKNALTFTVVGKIVVATYYDENRQQVCLQIKDTGVGIAKEEVVHVFDRFYRGEDVSKLNIPGSGLGLTIVKEIVTLHGGTVQVQSERDHGSTFQIFLPIA